MSGSFCPLSTIVKTVLTIFGVKKTAAVLGYCKTHTAARLTLICLALVTQIAALLVLGFLGLLLGVFFRTMLF